MQNKIKKTEDGNYIMENKEPLYCYKFIESADGTSARLDKYIITDWRLAVYSAYSKAYVFNGSYIHSIHRNESIDIKKLDRFVSNKLYTFNPDETYAAKCIENALKEKLHAATMQLQNCEQKLDLWYHRS